MLRKWPRQGIPIKMSINLNGNRSGSAQLFSERGIRLGTTSEERILSAISHLGLFFHLPGLFIALLIYLFKRESSAFIAQHALQAIGFQVVVMLIGGVFGFGAMGLVFGGLILGGAAGVAGVAVFLWFTVVLLALCAAVGIYRALLGKDFTYPLVGEFIKKIG